MPKLHHIALGAQNVEALAAFYRNALDLLEPSRHLHPDGSLRSIWLALGDALLMIEAAETPPPPRADREAGWCLLALTCAAQNLGTQTAALLQANATADGHTASTRYFRDPEGNRFALSCYPDTP